MPFVVAERLAEFKHYFRPPAEPLVAWNLLETASTKTSNTDMSERIDAIFENGVFRPEVPVNIPNGERVSLDVSLGGESKSIATDDLGDVADLLDGEFMDSCRRNAGPVPPLEEVRRVLSVFTGSLADRIAEERDER